MKRFTNLKWDSWNIGHIASHNVIPEEAEEAIFSRSSRVRKGRGDNIYYVFGQTLPGRYLFIVLRDLGNSTAFPLTTRDMTNSEKKLYKDMI